MFTLYCGDCFDYFDKIQDNSVDLLLTDPPYNVIGKDFEWDNVDIVSFTQKWWNICKVKMKPDSSCYIFWSQKHLKVGLEIFEPDRVLIWHHPNLAKPTTKMFLYTYDFIFYKKFGNPHFLPSFSLKENVDIFVYAKPQTNFKHDKRYHPASKPLKLVENFVKISSKKDDVVLDIFMGAGTTGVACANLGRQFIGIEKEEKYFTVAQARIYQNMATNREVLCR